MYGLDIPVIGLTGGIATGKSTAASILKEKNLPVIDADALVKDVYALEQTKRLVEKLAPSVIKDEKIDFKLLREIFFTNPEVKTRLEQHIYALLPQEFAKRLAEFGKPRFIIYDVPLLFEKGLHHKVDQSVLIYTPKDTQLERLVKRDKIDPELAYKILGNQMPINEKRELSDFVIENTSDINNLKVKIEELLESLFISV